MSHSLLSFVTNESPMLNFELKEYDVCVDNLNISESLMFLKTTKINLRLTEEIAILSTLYQNHFFPPTWIIIHGEKP